MKTNLSKAFAELRKLGYVALQNANLDRVNAKRTPESKGSCFYTPSCFVLNPYTKLYELYISFDGGYCEATDTCGDFESAAHEILDVFTRHGIKASWGGGMDSIHVTEGF